MSDIIRITGTAVTAVSPVQGISLVTYQLLNGIIQQMKIGGDAPHISIGNISNPDDALRLTSLASVTWDNGKQIRVYYINRNYVLSDFIFTGGNPKWTKGKVSNLGIKVAPGAGLAAAVTIHDNKAQVHVFYQEPEAYAIKELIDKVEDGESVRGNLELTNALVNTNLAAVAHSSLGGKIQINLLYQDKGLFFKEYRSDGDSWSDGSFDYSKAPAESPVTAIIFGSAADIKIQVYWRSVEGKVVRATKVGDSWNYHGVIGEIEAGHKFSAVQWENGTKLKLCYQNFDRSLVEFYSDNAGGTWSKGEQI